MSHSSGSLLLGRDGIVVESVTVGDDGARTVHVGTAGQWVGVCPGCRTRSSRSRGWVTTRPRDIKIGPDRPRIIWRKRKWLCGSMSCERKSFTEAVPAVPPRARVTARAQAEMGLAVLDDDRSVAAVAGAYGCCWNTCHDAVTATADAVLAAEPAAVSVLGIDETRRGKAKYPTCPETGTRIWVDRFDTGLVDITGTAGLLVQVNGRSAKPFAQWLKARDQVWPAGIAHVAIDMSVTYAKAARDALPHAQLIVDRFHLVKRANQMVEAVRRRTSWDHRGRRGRKTDPEWINRRRLLRGAERLTDTQRTRLVAALDAADPTGDILGRLDRQGAAPRPIGLQPTTGGLRYHISARAVPVLRVLRRHLGARNPRPRRNHRNLAGTNDAGHHHRPVQRPQRRPQPHRQTHRTHRVRIPQPRQPTTPSTVGLHPTNTTGAIQGQTTQALLTRKSLYGWGAAVVDRLR